MVVAASSNTAAEIGELAAAVCQRTLPSFGTPLKIAIADRRSQGIRSPQSIPTITGLLQARSRLPRAVGNPGESRGSQDATRLTVDMEGEMSRSSP